MKILKRIYLVPLILGAIDIGQVSAARWDPVLSSQNVFMIRYDSVTKTYWFGTVDNGVWKFDGRELQQLLPKTGDGRVVEEITALAINGKKSELWVGTPIGLFCYHIPSQEWDGYDRCSGLSENWITALFVDTTGTLWYGSKSENGDIGGGIGKMDSTGWHRYTTTEYAKWDSSRNCPNCPKGCWVPDTTGTPIPGPKATRNKVLCITQDREGNLYFGTSGAGLCVLNHLDKSWTCVDNFASAYNNFVKTIAIDREGNKWLGTLEGVCVLDTSYDFVKCFTSDSGLVDNTVNAIWIDSFQNGDLKWFGTEGGVSVLDSTDNRWKNFTNENSGMASNLVQDIIGDNDGNLWFAMLQSGGVIKLNNNWAELTVEDGLSSNFVRAIEKDKDGRLWVGTNNRGGFDVLEHGTWKRVTLDDPTLCSGAPVVLDFVPDNTAMWVATAGCGIFRISHNLAVTPIKRFVPEFPSDIIYTLVVRQDTLWAGTEQGVIRVLLRAKSVKRYLEGRIVTALAYDLRGQLWAGTNSGLWVFDGSQWIEKTISPFAQNVTITAITRDLTGTMWIATNDGIARIDSFNTIRFSTHDGLPSNGITTIAVAPDGTVWCGTVRGAAAFAGHQWIPYTTDAGLSRDFIYQIAFGPPEVVWFATWGGGISRYRKTHVRPETYFPETFDIVTETNVTISYAGYDFNTPAENLLYQYAFEDTLNWSSVTTQTSVKWIVDTDGLHKFYVRAIDADGNQDDSPAEMRFYKVRPQQGGVATIVDSTRVQLRIYVPPNALQSGVSIRATPVTIDTAGFAQKKLPFTGIAYDLGPDSVNIKLNKPLTLTIFYGDSITRQFDERKLMIYRREGQWLPIGGAVDTKRHAITTTLTQLDTIALFEEFTVGERGLTTTTLSNVAAQPRILSPKGGGFAEGVTVSFDLSKPAEVTAKVYNLAGRLVRILCDNHSMMSGRQVVVWDGRNHDREICTTGLYIVTLEAAGELERKTVMVLNKNQ